MTKPDKPGEKTRPPKAPKGKGRARLWNMTAIIGTVAILAGVAIWPPSLKKARAAEIVVYKSPTCGCCRDWVDHLRDEGFRVTAHDRKDMSAIKAQNGITRKLASCHTALVEGYVVEGHVPARDIKRLLEEKPAVAGLAVPGMPMGSPGMEGAYEDPYDVLTFDKNGRTRVFSSY